MTISKRQFDLLQAMGITVWQRRDLASFDSSSAETDDIAKTSTPATASANLVATKAAMQSSPTPSQQTTNIKPIAINLDTLRKQSFFNDVIRCLGVSKTDVVIENNQLNLGIINWQFTDNDSIEFKHNCLKTPDLKTLANSPALKKDLWQSIGSLSAI